MSETCYIGVVGSGHDDDNAMLSITNMRRREGDQVEFRFATKGFAGRQKHIDNFIDNTTHDYILMLDRDMVFPADTLERLREHKRPFVSGLYMRRRWSPVAPVWFEPFDGTWPMRPFLRDPKRGQLHEIGASGWGCMLMHRDVILNTRPLLKGEAEIIEDDMDVWPYSLQVMMTLIEELKAVSDVGVARAKAQQLASEFRPLTATKENVGSDIRFPFFALEAGYQLYGDPDVRCGHIISYPLSPNDFQETPQLIEVQADVDQVREEWQKQTSWLNGKVAA